MVYPKAYNSAITAEWIAKNTFEIISRVKICAISSAKATSPLEKLARIGSRNTQVKMNPKTPQTKSTIKTHRKIFRARCGFPWPMFCRIKAAPPSPMLPAGTVDRALTLFETPSATHSLGAVVHANRVDDHFACTEGEFFGDNRKGNGNNLFDDVVLQPDISERQTKDIFRVTQIIKAGCCYHQIGSRVATPIMTIPW